VRRIALVSCGQRKLARHVEAQELYTSNLFRLSAEYARSFDAWYILSAAHGLLKPETVLAPYDASLADMRMEERQAWGGRVARRLLRFEPGVNGGRIVGAARTQERHGSNEASTRITVLAGRLYAEALAWDIASEQPLKGLGIGERLAWLKRQSAICGDTR
jgi:Family of unknown function (DUF6884)